MSQRKLTAPGTLTLAIAIFVGCATVDAGPEGGPPAEAPTTDLTMSGETPAAGGNNVVVASTGGTPTGPGGQTAAGGSPVDGGDGDSGDGDGDDTPEPNGMRCEDDSECDVLPGCQTCELDAASFLFTCQEATELLECDSTCVDTNTSNDHCGACDHACSTGATCTAGTCVCDGAALLCDEVCVDTQTDPNNCGACGETCEGETPFCIAGECAACESPGEDKCGGVCTNRQTDDSNCGTCGNACDTGAGEECLSGTCGVGICGAEEEYNSAAHNGFCNKQRAINNGHLWECGHWVDSAPPSSPNGNAAPCTAHEWCYVGPCQ